jgi:hypothetical protein
MSQEEEEDGQRARVHKENDVDDDSRCKEGAKGVCREWKGHQRETGRKALGIHWSAAIRLRSASDNDLYDFKF